MNKTEGRKKMESLSKQEYFALRQMKQADIARLYKISISTAASAMKILSVKYGAYKPKTSRLEVSLPPEEKIPFSTNEDDYILYKKGDMITKNGLLSFNGNSPIKPMRTALQEAVENYKLMLLEKKLKLLKS